MTKNKDSNVICRCGREIDISVLNVNFSARCRNCGEEVYILLAKQIPLRLEDFFEPVVTEEPVKREPVLVEIKLIKQLAKRTREFTIPDTIRATVDFLKITEYKKRLRSVADNTWQVPLALHFTRPKFGLIIYKNAHLRDYEKTDAFFDPKEALKISVRAFEIDKLKAFNYIRVHNTVISVKTLKIIIDSIRGLYKSKKKDPMIIQFYVRNLPNFSSVALQIGVYTFLLPPEIDFVDTHLLKLLPLFKAYIDVAPDVLPHDLEINRQKYIDLCVKALEVSEFLDFIQIITDLHIYSYEDIVNRKSPYIKAYNILRKRLDLEKEDLDNRFWIHVIEFMPEFFDIPEIFPYSKRYGVSNETLRALILYLSRFKTPFDFTISLLQYFSDKMFEAGERMFISNTRHVLAGYEESGIGVDRAVVGLQKEAKQTYKRILVTDFLRRVETKNTEENLDFGGHNVFTNFIKHFRPFIKNMSIGYIPTYPLLIKISSAPPPHVFIFLITSKREIEESKVIEEETEEIEEETLLETEEYFGIEEEVKPEEEIVQELQELQEIEAFIIEEEDPEDITRFATQEDIEKLDELK